MEKIREVKIKKVREHGPVHFVDSEEKSIVCAFENGRYCSPDCAAYTEETRFKDGDQYDPIQAAICQRDDLFIGKIVQ